MAGCVYRRSILSAMQVMQVLSGPAGVALVLWLLLKTRTASAVDWSGSVKIVTRRLRAEGVSEEECHKIIKESARQLLGPHDQPLQLSPSQDTADSKDTSL